MGASAAWRVVLLLLVVVVGAVALTIGVAAVARASVQWTLVAGLIALVASIAVGDVPNVIHWLERARGEQIAEFETVINQGLEL